MNSFSMILYLFQQTSLFTSMLMARYLFRKQQQIRFWICYPKIEVFFSTFRVHNSDKPYYCYICTTVSGTNVMSYILTLLLLNFQRKINHVDGLDFLARLSSLTFEY